MSHPPRGRTMFWWVPRLERGTGVIYEGNVLGSTDDTTISYEDMCETLENC